MARASGTGTGFGTGVVRRRANAGPAWTNAGPAPGAIALTLIAVLAACLWPAPSDAYVTDAQARSAAARAADWFGASQSDDGGLGGGGRLGEWSLASLASAGVNAADVKTSLTDPSAQDYYQDFWATRGPGAVACPPGSTSDACADQPDGLPTDAERVVLSGVAGGIRPSAVSAGRNYVSRIAYWWDGTQIGYPTLLNDDVFGVLALAHQDAPAELLRTLSAPILAAQLPDGGWHWDPRAKDHYPDLTSDTDVTGAALAALCASGMGPGDPAIDRGISLLESRQAGDGGFGSGWSAPNTSSTAWAVDGLNQCGVDPQQLRFTSERGSTPLDFLLAMQNDDGSFRAAPGSAPGQANLMSTYQAVSPLAGDSFTTIAPARRDPSLPRMRPAPDFADGTSGSIMLSIDGGTGLDPADRSRMCRVGIEQGSGLAAVLKAAEASSQPGGCVAGVTTSTGPGGATVIEAMDGDRSGPGGAWTISVDGSGPATGFSGGIGLGEMVELAFTGQGASPGSGSDPGSGGGGGSSGGDVGGSGGEGGSGGRAPSSPAPAIEPEPIRAAPPAWAHPRARIAGRPRLRGRRAIARLRCPRGAGAQGCQTTVRFKLRLRRAGHRFRGLGSKVVSIPAGKKRRVASSARRGVARRVRRLRARGRHRRMRLRVVAGTRSPDGVVRFSRRTAGVR